MTQVKSEDNWHYANLPLKDYPIGTKAKALMGGHWVKTEMGWKWFNGATFPNPGGDWTGEVSIPQQTLKK